MQCRVEPTSFELVAREWDDIFTRCAEPSVFDSLVWQRSWWEHFGAGSELRLSKVTSSDGNIRLIAAFSKSGSKISFLGGTDLVDYHGFLSDGGAVGVEVAAVVVSLCAEQACTTIELLSLPEASPAVELVPEILRQKKWHVEVEREDVAPRLTLPTTWEAYLEVLSKKDRHELRRKMRRLESAGAVQDVELKSPDDVASQFDSFLSLHRKSTPEKAEFMTATREQFFRSVSRSLAEAGMTRLRFLELDGKKVATSLSFVVGGVRYLYNSGYDPEFREFSVGLMNHAYGIKASIEEGIRVFDFMRGNEPYKYSLGATDRVLYRIKAERPAG